MMLSKGDLEDVLQPDRAVQVIPPADVSGPAQSGGAVSSPQYGYDMPAVARAAALPFVAIFNPFWFGLPGPRDK